MAAAGSRRNRSLLPAAWGAMQSLLTDLVVIFTLSVLAAVVRHRLRLPSAIGPGRSWW